MKSKHNLNIEGAPFTNCRLNRERSATMLTNIVNNYKDGFVLALDGEWGTGKTTFVKMWEQKLNVEGHKTIYFNSWENDFVSEPLVAILGELKTLFSEESYVSFDSLLGKVEKFAKGVIPVALKCVGKKYLGEDAVEALVGGIDAAENSFNKEVSEYGDKKADLNTFKLELERLINEKREGKPLIFIVDELDRCRPDYAVEVLEKIKHFFSVRGVVFVIAIDKAQLANSVRGYYGSDLINADEYLRRFIDIEYSLPKPDAKMFCEYLYNYFEFKAFLESNERMSSNDSRNDKDFFLQTIIGISDAENLSLRGIEKLLVYTRLILTGCNQLHSVYPDLVFMLIYLKYYKPIFYNKIESYGLTLDELEEEINSIFQKSLKKESLERSPTFLTDTIIRLIVFYSNDIKGNLLIEKEGEQCLRLRWKGVNQGRLKELATYYVTTPRTIFPIKYFIEKINLLNFQQ